MKKKYIPYNRAKRFGARYEIGVRKRVFLPSFLRIRRYFRGYIRVPSENYFEEEETLLKYKILIVRHWAYDFIWEYLVVLPGNQGYALVSRKFWEEWDFSSQDYVSLSWGHIEKLEREEFFSLLKTYFRERFHALSEQFWWEQETPTKNFRVKRRGNRKK